MPAEVSPQGCQRQVSWIQPDGSRANICKGITLQEDPKQYAQGSPLFLFTQVSINWSLTSGQPIITSFHVHLITPQNGKGTQ